MSPRERSSFLTIGIGVNVNVSPIDGSTNIKKHIGQDFDVNEFIQLLSKYLFQNLDKLKNHGFNAIRPEIEKRLEYKG